LLVIFRPEFNIANLKLETRNQKLKSWREQIILYAPAFDFGSESSFFFSSRPRLVYKDISHNPSDPRISLSGRDRRNSQLYHGIIRKCAHLTEYAVLGLLACRAFKNLSAATSRKYFYLLAAALVVAVASADEFNQSFNPERTGSPIDVLIDISGWSARDTRICDLGSRRSISRDSR
jgi:VanZ family protein